MDFEWLFEKPIAHRGLHDDAYPENSIPAYEAAIKNDCNIEIDVHVSKDGQVVVFHDDNLKRVCGVDKLIKDCTVEELKTYRLKGSEYTIPTFKEFLDCVRGRTGVLCEIKGLNPFDFSIVKATIKELEGYEGPIALQSFNYTSVRYARKHSTLPSGELCTWSSMDGKTLRWRPANFMGKMWVCKISKPDFIAYNVTACDKSLPEHKWLRKWEKKLPILMWTINSPEKIEIAKNYANNIIFETISSETAHEALPTLMPFKCPESRLPKNFTRAK